MAPSLVSLVLHSYLPFLLPLVPRVLRNEWGVKGRVNDVRDEGRYQGNEQNMEKSESSKEAYNISLSASPFTYLSWIFNIIICTLRAFYLYFSYFFCQLLPEIVILKNPVKRSK